MRDLDVLRRRERSVFGRPRGERYDDPREDEDDDDELGHRDDRDPGDGRGRGPHGRR